ncbi:MAG TPA: histidine phosphatase family protein [Candidatus Nanoarchaeia archaeon]|nr:histidine phosphatase family protein [Candidatus Nanoarchaeia archaeon]
MKSAKIYLFRHGQTTFNRDAKFTGFIDALLTQTGRDDAKIIAERLKHKRFQTAFHTRLIRSKDTLKEVLKYHPECTQLMQDDRMIEREYGSLSGKTHWNIVKERGVEKYDLWHRGFSARPPRGESFADVEKRVSSFIKDLIAYVKKEKVNVAISAHGNSIRLFRKIMEKASPEEAVSWIIPYDNYYEYTITL